MTDPRALFDTWAPTDDADVRAAPDAFPFAGYDAVLDGLAELVRGAGTVRVLELGVGTGALAARIAAAIPGVEIWGVDFSPRMLARARAKVPDARFLESDLDRDLPALALPPVDAVVAAYVLHELPDERKLAVVEHLLDDPRRRRRRRGRRPTAGTRASTMSSPTLFWRGCGSGASSAGSARSRSAPASSPFAATPATGADRSPAIAVRPGADVSRTRKESTNGTAP